jgi:transposase
MDIVVERCCGLDVHKDTVVACVRTPGKGGKREVQTRTFGTMTTDLLALRDWLVAMGVTLVGMESTGIYWKCVKEIRELRDLTRYRKAQADTALWTDSLLP